MSCGQSRVEKEEEKEIQSLDPWRHVDKMTDLSIHQDVPLPNLKSFIWTHFTNHMYKLKSVIQMNPLFIH